MTPAQTKFYWREWAACWRAMQRMKPELTYQDANRERHDLQRRALGYPRSSSDLDNREFDAVLAAFRSWSRPDDIDSQCQPSQQPRIRLLWKLDQAFAQLTDAIGGSAFAATEYMHALMDDRWHTRDIGDLSDRGLRQLLITLTARISSLRARSASQAACSNPS